MQRIHQGDKLWIGQNVIRGSGMVERFWRPQDKQSWFPVFNPFL